MRKRTLLFLALAFAYSWAVASVLYIFRIPPYALLAVSTAYMFGPALAVLTLKVLRHPLPDLGLRFNPNAWWLVAWLFPPFIVLLTFVVDLLMPGVSLSPHVGDALLERLSHSVSSQDVGSIKEAVSTLTFPMIIALFFYGMIAGVTINAIVSLGEEVGWRGFLYSELKGMGFWRMSYTVGVLWGLWHAPLILKGHNYPIHPVPGVLMMILFTTLLSPLMFHIRERANSTLAAAIFHGTLNGVAGFDLLFLRGGNDLTVGITGLSGLLVLSALNVGLYLLRKRDA